MLYATEHCECKTIKSFYSYAKLDVYLHFPEVTKICLILGDIVPIKKVIYLKYIYFILSIVQVY